MELPDLNEMEDVILTIEEEDGTETECQVICMFEYGDRAYAALTPTDENIAEAYLFGVTFEDQGDEVEFTIENIDDDELLQEVGQVFESIMEEANAEEEAQADPSGDGDDSVWDEFINKKLEDL